jgi:hypothetical protein
MVNKVIKEKDSNFTVNTIEATGQYQKVALLVREWVEIHKGESFDLDMICRQLQIQERTNRKYVAIELSKLAGKETLEKVTSPIHKPFYRYIDNTCKYIDWVNASTEDVLDIKWPYGVGDDSRFGFDGRVKISPGDIAVIAGTSNMGKSAFCQNFLWENMDNFPCTLMGNEYTPGKFKRRTSRMTWKSPIDEEGEPKFELIDRRQNWKDIIRPDNINIIDWLNLGDNWYAIGKVIEEIQGKLHNGIALIAIQKDEHKTLGRGASFSEELASLYLVIDYERLFIRKAKEWREWNPNGKIYGFSIVDGGTKFHNIRLIRKCKVCWGSGHSKGGQCESCNGTGYVDDN